MMNDHDRNLLRKFAYQIRSIASSPEMEEKRKQMKAHNDLKKNTKPIVLCFPEGAWEEIFHLFPLECEHELARAWERKMRITIFTHEYLKDDQVFEPYFDVGWRVSDSGFGVDAEYHTSGERGSYAWKSALNDLSDAELSRLKPIKFVVEEKETLMEVEQAKEVFGDILPVRLRGFPFWTLGLTSDAIKLIGLEGFMLNLYDNPEGVHKLMHYLQTQYLDVIDYLQNNRYLALNNECDYVGSGGQGYTDELPQGGKVDDPITARDLWALAESQETVGVSPDMFNEFVLQYQLPILDKFGLVCYGCCEPLHDRWHYIQRIPRLRRISVSPWCDQAFMADALAGKQIFSRKPNPSLVCVGFDERNIRQDIQNTLDIAKACNLEIILKDTHTVEFHPERLKRWVEIAKQEIEK